ncbi:hypothetical protein [Deinococcus multiflagellatus]|uniref:Peroxiredoxin n=1 Tax=Deinococcus multiflagellatus TaxID=1656887 RepID=A0ABW1ZKL7_9DEIO
MTDLHALPADLPAPVDDGACAHLPGQRLPAAPLPGTDGRSHDLSALPGRTVVYVYPKTGRPDGAMPDDWDQIPGARGCTPQSCAFRDHHAELQAADARVFGLSVQPTPINRRLLNACTCLSHCFRMKREPGAAPWASPPSRPAAKPCCAA